MYDLVGALNEPEHLEASLTSYLTPESELLEIELGARVDYWLTFSILASVYSTEDSRAWGYVSNMVTSVAAVTSWRGAEFPEEWLPDLKKWDYANGQ